jgi:hypothetical protein
MGAFEHDGINIYKVDAKLQTADIGTERIACLDTWRSNCILINLSEPGVDAAQRRALSSSLRRDAIEKLRTREEQQRAKALECAGTRAGFAGARGGGFEPKFQKKKRIETNKVGYDDSAARSCLCCGDYDTDCEPTYPCRDFRDVDLWSNEMDGVDETCNMQRVPCEQIPGQLCRSCDDDECVGRNVTCGTLAIYYQRAVVDFARGHREPAEAFSGDDDDAAEDNDRVRDPSDARRNGDVVRENVWCDQKQHLGSIRYSHGAPACVAKPMWRKRRSHDADAERPFNLSEHIDGIMELLDDDYLYASSSGMNNNDMDLSDACGVRDPEEWEIIDDDILGEDIEYLQTSQTVQIPQPRKPDTVQMCVVDRLPYETFVIDKRIAPFLFDDVHGLRSALRYGCLENACDVADCFPCEDQSAIVSESHDFEWVIIEWCYGRDSRLGRPSKYSQVCKVIRLTIDDDLRTLNGLHRALEIVEQCPQDRTLLWSAMPCAGGSPLQKVNKARGFGTEKLNAHWRDFYILWGNFVAEEVIGVGVVVTVEWPEANDYWEQPDVI